MRSTGNIEHSVQLFAFISIDFNRMHRASFRLWAKPKLVVRDGELVIANAPIGRNFRLIGWVERRRNLAERFNVWRLVKRVQASFESDEAAPGDELDQGVETRVEGVEAPDSASVEVATAIFAALAERNRAKGSTLVLVHLPSMADLQAGDGTALYRSWDRAITELAAQHDYVYIDLVRELTKLPADDRRRLFNTHDLEGYRPAGGHYSAYGNAVVARALYDQLTQVPAIRDRLAALPHADMQ